MPRHVHLAPHDPGERTCGGHNPFNLPNVLTYGRVAAVPVVVACMFWPDEFWMRWVALGIFAVAGHHRLLRRLSRPRLVAAIDARAECSIPSPTSCWSAATLLMLVADRTISSWSIWAAIVILSREILVSGLREYLAELRVSVPVSTVAKWKTTLQLVAIGFLIVGPAGEHVLPGTVMIGLVLLWIAALLTLYTGWDYFRAGIHHIVDHGA